MGSYLVKRILSMIPTMFFISICLFTLMKIMPQDPVKLSMPSYVKVDQYEIVYEEVKEKLGLNESIVVQYAKWMSNLMHGDLGTSIQYKKPVIEVIGQPLLHTLYLNAVVLVVSFGIAIFGAIQSALRVHKGVDYFWQGVSILGMSIPTFFLALLLIYVFAFQFPLLPYGGMPLSNASIIEWLRYLALPVASMVLLEISGTLRYVRSAMLEELQADYIYAAKARGIKKHRIIWHALRNCWMPVITIFMANVSTLFMGSILIENIFAYDGIGRVLLTALEHRDFMLAIALNILYALVYLNCNLLADILYALSDVRVRLR